MKVVFVLLDGLADRRWPELDGRTPLEAARTPNLDRLAKMGLTGLVHPLGRGLAPSSEIAHFALFGYSMDEYPGRGVFEAVGHGLKVEYDEVVLHSLFSSVVPEGNLLKVVERPIVASDEECKSAMERLRPVEHKGITIETVFTNKAQAITFVRGAAAKEVTDSDPYHPDRPVSNVLPTRTAGDEAAAVRTAEALRNYLAFAHKAMDASAVNAERRSRGKRPINFLLMKWAGKRGNIPSFEIRNGFRGASICSYPLYKGLVTQLGMACFDTPYLPDAGEDLLNRFSVAREVLDQGFEFLHVHSKAPDDAGHEKDPRLKRKVIERLDEAFGHLIEGDLLDDEILLVVTGDHATPSGTDLLHSGDPVPVLMVGKNAWPDRVESFGETACVYGGLGQFTGKELMPTLLNLTDRVRYLGSTLTREPTIYEPRSVPPFILD